MFLLTPGVVVLDGVRFLGTTLWTDYMMFGREGFTQAMAEALVGLNTTGDPDARRLPAGPDAIVHAGGCAAPA